MKIKVIEESKPKVVPPLTLEVTFETEAEMREFRCLIGPLRATGPTDCFYKPLGAHLDKYSEEEK